MATWFGRNQRLASRSFVASSRSLFAPAHAASPPRDRWTSGEEVETRVGTGGRLWANGQLVVPSGSQLSFSGRGSSSVASAMSAWSAADRELGLRLPAASAAVTKLDR